MSSVKTGIEDVPSENVGMLETMGFDEVATGIGLEACATLVTGALDIDLADAETCVGIDVVVGRSFDFSCSAIGDLLSVAALSSASLTSVSSAP